MIAAELLMGALPQVELRHWGPQAFHGITDDSRRVTPGDLFVAVPGIYVDGHRFVPSALAAGASACVVERLLPELEGLPTAIVPDAREALAHLQAAAHGFPGRQLRVIGVTGTDGKTTTVRLIASILQAAGRAVGRVDTVSATIGGTEADTGFHTTTPTSADVQGYLARMVAEKMEYAILETTSEGLAQHRVTACEFDVAVVTNITHDHLYYHKTHEDYREAKARLFRFLEQTTRKPDVPKVAVTNADDAAFDYLRAIPAEWALSYGLRQPADVSAREIRLSPEGLHFVAQVPGGELPIDSPLVGQFNVYNLLAAIAVAHSQGIPVEAIQAGIREMRGVRGRMERVYRGQPFTVIVDFAHTPNALENALQTVRTLTDGRVAVVFGCAGLRDLAKRPWMGEIAGRLADRTVITAEDPRTESLDDIMEQVAEGCRKAGRVEGRDFWRIGDRGEAIARALAMAQPGDLVMVTGKGHEPTMCFGQTEYPWSDHQAVLEGLAKLGYS